jgi:hypothetical protein
MRVRSKTQFKGLEAPVFIEKVESLLKKGRFTQYCGDATVHGCEALSRMIDAFVASTTAFRLWLAFDISGALTI